MGEPCDHDNRQNFWSILTKFTHRVFGAKPEKSFLLRKFASSVSKLWLFIFKYLKNVQLFIIQPLTLNFSWHRTALFFHNMYLFIYSYIKNWQLIIKDVCNVFLIDNVLNNFLYYFSKLLGQLPCVFFKWSEYCSKRLHIERILFAIYKYTYPFICQSPTKFVVL